MSGFLLRRLGMSVLVLLGVAAIVFFSLFLTGDPAALMFPPAPAAPRSTPSGKGWVSTNRWWCSPCTISATC